jgi:hypothetical protein
MRSISAVRRNRAFAAADNSKLHGCSFELDMELLISAEIIKKENA